jgi:hypothetical protein
MRLRPQAQMVASLVLVSVLGLAACGKEPPAAPYADLAGAYDMVTVNTAALPYNLGSNNWLMQGSLTLGEDGRAVLKGRTQAAQTGIGPTFPEGFSQETAFSRRDTTIVFESRFGIYFENALGRFTAPGRLAVTAVQVLPDGRSLPPVTIVYQRPGATR